MKPRVINLVLNANTVMQTHPYQPAIPAIVCRSEEAELAARNASLLDSLTDLTRQASTATTHPLLDWLRLLTQVNRQQPQQQQPQQPRQQQVAARLAEQQRREDDVWQQERQAFLREVVRLRATLQVGLRPWRPAQQQQGGSRLHLQAFSCSGLLACVMYSLVLVTGGLSAYAVLHCTVVDPW